LTQFSDQKTLGPPTNPMAHALGLGLGLWVRAGARARARVRAGARWMCVNKKCYFESDSGVDGVSRTTAL